MNGAAPRDDLADWGRALLWLELLLAAVLFSARTSESFELPKVALLRAVALALLGGAVAAGARASRPRDPFALGAVLSLLAALASTALAISPRTALRGAEGSFGGLGTLAAYAVLFAAARALCGTPGQARAVLGGAGLGAGVAVAYGLLQLAGLDPFRWQAPVVYARLPRVFSTQGHPNALAQLLATSWPVVVYLAAHARHERRRFTAVAWVAVGVGSLALMPFTLSRAGLLALVAAVVAGGACRARPPGRPWWWAGAALLVALALLPGATHEGLQHRIANPPAALAGEPRLHLWSAALALFREHPLLGVGPDCFGLAYGGHRTAQAWNAEWGETPLSAHGLPFDLLASGGLLGLAAALPFAIGITQAARRAREAEEPLLAAAAVAGLAAFGAHLLFHPPSAAAASLAAVLCGVLSSRGEAAAPAPGGWWRRLAAGIVTTAAVVVLVVGPLRADVLGQAGTNLTVNDPHRAATLLGRAVQLDPGRELLWLRLSAALQAAARLAGRPAEAGSLRAEARRAAEEGVRLSPRSAHGRAHLGTLLSDLERATPPQASRAEVARAFEQALALDPTNANLHVAAGRAALLAGDLDEAERLAVRCAELYPRHAPAWALHGAALLARGERERAAALLSRALRSNWRGDEAGRAAAEANLRAAEAGAEP